MHRSRLTEEVKQNVFFSHRGCGQPAVFVLGVVHVAIKIVELLVTQVVRVHQVELPASVMVTLVVADSWEIQPFWMAELITYITTQKRRYL